MAFSIKEVQMDAVIREIEEVRAGMRVGKKVTA